MMKLFWTPEAIQDRITIYDHIEADNPLAALDLDARFEEQAALLIGHPDIGRPGRVPDTRELVVHPHYILIYDIAGHQVRMLNVVHTARLWPPALEH